MIETTTVVFPEPLETPRLTLRALTADALDAWVVEDRAAVSRAMGATLTAPLSAPPLDVADLVHIREGLRGEPGEPGWWVWMVVLRRTAEPIGMVTLTGSPETDGGMACGYSLYADQRGHEYEEEALTGMLAWTLAQPGIPFVRAAVPAGNEESKRIVEHVGMVAAGVAEDPELGEIVVFERTTGRDPDKG